MKKRGTPCITGFLRRLCEAATKAARTLPDLKIADTDCIREVTERVVKGAAEAGECVIVGRGSAYYLQNRRDAFHVFVYAPLDDKVRRLRAGGKSENEAVQLAETVDSDRAAFIKQYFGVEWPGRHRFHLMINSTMGEETAVETILDSIALFEKHKTGSATVASAADRAMIRCRRLFGQNFRHCGPNTLSSPTSPPAALNRQGTALKRASRHRDHIGRFP